MSKLRNTLQITASYQFHIQDINRWPRKSSVVGGRLPRIVHMARHRSHDKVFSWPALKIQFQERIKEENQIG